MNIQHFINSNLNSTTRAKTKGVILLTDNRCQFQIQSDSPPTFKDSRFKCTSHSIQKLNSIPWKHRLKSFQLTMNKIVLLQNFKKDFFVSKKEFSIYKNQYQLKGSNSQKNTVFPHKKIKKNEESLHKQKENMK